MMGGAHKFSCRQGALVVALVLLMLALLFRPAPAAAAGPAKRIVSLAPSLTETCFALGLGAKVVGRTSFCNYPAAAAKVPAVGALTGWNEELVVSLKPDLILALEGDRAPVERLSSLTGARLLVLTTESLADIGKNVTAIGRAAGATAKSEAMLKALRTQLAARKRKAATRKTHPTVFYMVWDEPLMAASPHSYIGDLITVAGGRNVVPASVSGSYPTFGWEPLLAADPQVFLAPHDRTAALSKLSRRYPDMACVRGKRLHTLPDDLVSRPGPRVMQALDAVIAAIYKK